MENLRILEMKKTEQEKRKAKELLDELNEIGPDGLEDWNIRAQTFLVFTAARNPFEDELCK